MNDSTESSDQEGDEEDEVSEKSNGHKNQQFSEEVLFSTETKEGSDEADPNWPSLEEDANSNSEKEDDKESKVR